MSKAEGSIAFWDLAKHESSPDYLRTPRTLRAPSFHGIIVEGWETSKKQHPPSRSHLVPRAFLEDAAERVAPLLLGKILSHRTNSAVLAGRIVEVEAYLGPHNNPPDPAAHTFRGPTPRNQVIFGPAGHAYVYAIYGRYFCMNVTCEVKGQAGCILVRALEPVTGLGQMAANRGLAPGAPEKMLTSGPGRLCQALGLTRALHNGLDLTSAQSPLQLLDDGHAEADALVTVRIGIKHAVDWPLRFVMRGHPCVSGPKAMR